MLTPAALLFMARAGGTRQSASGERRRTLATIEALLDEFRRAGWRLGVEDTLDAGATAVACFDASWASVPILFGMMEAPDLLGAVAGLRRLEKAGWPSVLRTQWIVGVRDLPAVRGERPRGLPSTVGFLALWNWNGAWHRASQEERRAYDAECDLAFDFDRRVGMNMSGRHASAWSSEWDHFSLWEAPDVDAIDRAMRVHERVKDFMFTRSRHVIGIKRDLIRLLEAGSDE
jgi:hypothetical protein